MSSEVENLEEGEKTRKTGGVQGRKEGEMLLRSFGNIKAKDDKFT